MLDVFVLFLENLGIDVLGVALSLSVAYFGLPKIIPVLAWIDDRLNRLGDD